MNGAGAADFAGDMDFSFKRIIDLDETALHRMAEVGGLADCELLELLSWTGQRARNVRTVFRGEIFVSRALRNPVIKGCPMCLREDVADHGGAPLEAMVMRGHWLMREASICVRHHHPLVPLWEARHPGKRFDIGSRLAEILPDLLDGALDVTCQPSTAYNLWLDARLEGGRDTTWLADKPLDAATTFCRLLGTDLLGTRDGPDLLPTDRIRAAQALGFEAARHGKESIYSALNRLLDTADDTKTKPGSAFSALHTALAYEKLGDDQFDAFRDVLREYILATWPVAAGEVVLGEPLRERRLHSVWTASQDTGLGTALVEQILVNAGALSADDGRPPNRRTFDARKYAGLLEELPTLVGPLELRKAMGATRAQLKSLIEDGVLVPRIDIPTLKSPWRLSDATDLVADLQGRAETHEEPGSAWETILSARNRSGVRVGTIISAIRDGNLRVAQRNASTRYGGFVVLKAEIDAIAISRGDLPDDTAMTAAVFGRKIGIRENGNFARLASAGYTPARWMKHPKTGVKTLYVSEADMAEFHARFLTLTTMATEYGEHRWTLLAKLRAGGVEPFAPDGEDYGHLYLRTEVEAAIR